MSPERRLNSREAQWTVQAIARGILTIGLWLSLSILVGGEERWSSPSYETALNYPYAPESWGWVIGAASVAGIVASLMGRLRIVAGSLFLIAVWALFFAWSFLDTAASNPLAATTGIPIYVGLAVACLLVGAVHKRSSHHAVHG